jgi:hypothetical protein
MTGSSAAPDLLSELRFARDGLMALAENDLSTFEAELASLEDAADAVGRAWSGSNLGYQANVYYKGLKRPPSGAFFSREWGFYGVFQGTVGDWSEQDRGEVKAAIYAMAGNVNTRPITQFAGDSVKYFRQLKDRVVSSLTLLLAAHEDGYLEYLLTQLRDMFVPSVDQLIKSQMRAETVAVRDTRASEGGWQSAPHLAEAAAAVGGAVLRGTSGADAGVEEDSAVVVLAGCGVECDGQFGQPPAVHACLCRDWRGSFEHLLSTPAGRGVEERLDLGVERRHLYCRVCARRMRSRSSSGSSTMPISMAKWLKADADQARVEVNGAAASGSLKSRTSRVGPSSSDEP